MSEYSHYLVSGHSHGKLVGTNMAWLVVTNMWAFCMRVDIVDNVDNFLAFCSPSLNVRCNETTFHHMKYTMKTQKKYRITWVHCPQGHFNQAAYGFHVDNSPIHTPTHTTHNIGKTPRK